MKNKKIKMEKESDGFLKKLLRAVSDKFYDFQVALNKCKKPKKTSNKRDKNRQLVFYIGWISLPLLQLLIFYFVANANSLLLAFQKYDIHTNSFKWAGLNNFKELAGNFMETGGALRVSLINSLIIFASKTLIGVSLALLFSL